MKQLIDSHCHINFIAYKDDADSVIQDFLKENYALMIVGSQESTSQRAIEYANKYERGVYAAVGLHPIDLVDETEDTVIMDGAPYTFKNRQEDFDEDKYRKLAKSSGKVKAIGEVGLDYFYFDKFDPGKISDFKIKQKEALAGFIKLAEELDLPIIFHGRGAKEDLFGVYDDMINLIREEIKNGRKIRGVIHCFGGNVEQAQKFSELGLYIGFTGIITFKKKSEALQEVVKSLPLDKILIETDAPFLSPEPHRGERCLPQYVKFVAEKIAEIKNISFEEIAEATTANAKNLFSI
ncbi:MAG: TatD family hydrolase [Patescibacteria group bacterium]|jgi:TatD DNase family protein